MRGLTAGATVTGVVALSLAIALAGRMVTPPPDQTAERAAGEVFGPPLPGDFALPELKLEPPHDPARPVATALVAPPQLDYGALEREAPRDPLGPLGQALPPPPVRPDDWDGTILYRPVAVGSAEFEAMGYPDRHRRNRKRRSPADLQVRRRRMAVRRQRAHGSAPVAQGQGVVLHRSARGRPAIAGRRLPAGQAGRWWLAGVERLGARHHRRSLRGGRAAGASSKARHFRATAVGDELIRQIRRR